MIAKLQLVKIYMQRYKCQYQTQIFAIYVGVGASKKMTSRKKKHLFVCDRRVGLLYNYVRVR